MGTDQPIHLCQVVIEMLQLILKKIHSNPNAANKIHLADMNASMAKTKRQRTKMLHNVYISRCETWLSATQETARSR